MKKITWKEIKDEWTMTLCQFIHDESRCCTEETQQKHDIMVDKITDLIMDQED